MHWTSAPNEQIIGVSLLDASWYALNEANGNFNRDSFILFVSERLPDSGMNEHVYGFSDSDKGRIEINLM